jgi:hypothetical protein
MHRPIVFERSYLATTGATWLPKDALVRYLCGLAEGLAVAFDSDTTCQQLFVRQWVARAWIVRTLSEGETIWESHHRFSSSRRWPRHAR